MMEYAMKPRHILDTVWLISLNPYSAKFLKIYLEMERVDLLTVTVA